MSLATKPANSNSAQKNTHRRPGRWKACSKKKSQITYRGFDFSGFIRWFEFFAVNSNLKSYISTLILCRPNLLDDTSSSCLLVTAFNNFNSTILCVQVEFDVSHRICTFSSRDSNSNHSYYSTEVTWILIVVCFFFVWSDLYARALHARFPCLKVVQVVWLNHQCI